MTLDKECLALYRRSRELYLVGRQAEAMAYYRRIRAEHGCELFYEVDLPSEMKLVHPLGSVLGRAAYASHLVVYQGVSVGSTVDHERPVFTGPCVLFPHSGVIGPVTVGKNVWITAGNIVEALPGKPFTIPDNCLVVTTGDGRLYLETERSVVSTFFSDQQP